jgi:hypothetical protein
MLHRLGASCDLGNYHCREDGMVWRNVKTKALESSCIRSVENIADTFGEIYF